MSSVSPSTARLVMAVASLLGLFFSAYLFYAYVTGGPIACALVSGCDIVRSSAWATSLGLPRPFFGLLFYGVLFQLLVFRVAFTLWPKPLYLFTRVLAFIGFLESGVLFVVQWIDLRAFCFWCLLSGLAATVIFVASFWDRISEVSFEKNRALELRRFLWALLVYVPLAVVSFVYLIR